MIKKTLCFSNPAYLSMRNNQLVIKLPEVELNDLPQEFKASMTRTIPIEDIGILVLDNGQITITQGLIESLLANSTAIISCDSNRMPIGLMLPFSGNATYNERLRGQINSTIPLNKQLWQQTIRCKIINQASILKKHRAMEINNMLIWSDNVFSGDITNLEARAAAYYWKNIFPYIPNFIRGREAATPNNLLNYGYAILRAVVARALVISGLLPALGIHHHNKYNAYCLADDIMEPYRPYVDELVLSIIESGIDYKDLTKDIKAKLLSIPVLDVVIETKRRPLMVAVGHTTASLYKCYSGESRKIIYPLL